MRVITASEMKGRNDHHQDYPREGTLAREIHDQLAASKGHAVFLGPAKGRSVQRSNAIRALQDFYGLDIRRIRNNHYILAGEWFGSHYSDYVAAAFHEGMRPKAGAA